MTTFTASEVRKLIERLTDHNHLPAVARACLALRAYADRLEADEKSHPIYQLMATDDSWWDVSRELYEAEGSHAGRTRILYTHPASADAERLAEALRMCMDIMLEHGVPTHPDANARVAYTAAEEALSAHSAQTQPPATSVPDEMVERARSAFVRADDGSTGISDAIRAALLAAQENPNG